MTIHRIKLYTFLVCAVLVICAIGCGGGGNTVPMADKTGPSITAVRADIPVGFNFKGGNITLSASIIDNTAVGVVHARMYKDGTLIASPELSHTGGTTYSAVYTMPANTTTRAQSYSIRVWAQDTLSNYAESSSTATFSVPAVGENPPGVPDI